MGKNFFMLLKKIKESKKIKELITRAGRRRVLNGLRLFFVLLFLGLISGLTLIDKFHVVSCAVMPNCLVKRQKI